jgi:hypothetical protein
VVWLVRKFDTRLFMIHIATNGGIQKGRNKKLL